MEASPRITFARFGILPLMEVDDCGSAVMGGFYVVDGFKHGGFTFALYFYGRPASPRREMFRCRETKSFRKKMGSGAF